MPKPKSKARKKAGKQIKKIKPGQMGTGIAERGAATLRKSIKKRRQMLKDI